MKMFKNVFLAFFVTALTSLNLVLPAYAEETTAQTVNTAGFSVNVVGDDLEEERNESCMEL